MGRMAIVVKDMRILIVYNYCASSVNHKELNQIELPE